MLEALERVKGALPRETALLGFCGAPWTVASYMIAGKGTPDQAPARVAAYRDPAFMTALIDRLVEASTAYLTAQIDAGADAVQIFESFGAALPPALFRPLSLEPIGRIVRGLKAARPKARIIVFVRGGGPNLRQLVEAGFADCVALDWTLDPAAVLPSLPKTLATQGNLDPLALVAGGEALERGIDAILPARARTPAHLQSRPRHRAGNPDRACRAHAGQGAERLMSRAAAAPPIAVSEEVVADLALVLVRHFLLALCAYLIHQLA